MVVSDPLNARPIGERAVATTTASGMTAPCEILVVNSTVAYVSSAAQLAFPAHVPAARDAQDDERDSRGEHDWRRQALADLPLDNGEDRTESRSRPAEPDARHVGDGDRCEPSDGHPVEPGLRVENQHAHD